MWEIFREAGILLLASLGYLRLFLVALYYGGLRTAAFIRDTFRAHHNLISQFTAPVEQELLQQTPPAPKDLNIFGQIALSILPLTEMAWLTALVITPFFYNSFLTTVSTFIQLTNLALYDLPRSQLALPQGTLPWYRIIYGLPGLFFGAVLGSLSALTVLSLRSISHSFKNTVSVFVAVTNLVLEETLPQPQFSQSLFLKLLGSPGYLSGAAFGLVAAALITAAQILRRTYQTSQFVFSRMVNVVLHSSDYLTETTLEQDPEKLAKSLLYGLPGYPLGFVAGLAGMLVIGVGRVFSNSFYSLKTGFDLAKNSQFSAAEAEKPRLVADNRPRLWKYGLGFAGFVLGLASGFFARFLTEIVNTTVELTLKASRAAGSPYYAQKIHEMDQRSNLDKYFFGFPGLVSGLGSAAVSFLSIGLARVVYHSALTMKNLVNSTTNVFLRDSDKLSADLGNDPRESAHIYGLGLPGLVLASIPALGAAILTLGFRITQESLTSGKVIFRKAINNALNENFIQGTARNRSFIARIYGAPGLVLGMLASIPGLLVILASRMTENSWKSAKRSFILLTNLALREKIAQEEDTRTNYQKLAGFPGLLLGSLAGLISFVGTGTARILVNTIYTTQDTFHAVINWNLQQKKDPELIEEPANSRSFAEMYGLGAAGLALGFLAGFPVRILIASAKSTRDIFAEVVNNALAKEDEMTIQYPGRSHFDLALGIPGTLLAFYLAAMALPFIISGRILINSFYTAQSLSYSAANLVRHNHAQNTLDLAHDQRPLSLQYLLGFPGIILGSIPALFAFGFEVARRTWLESIVTASRIIQRYQDAAWSLTQIDQADNRLFVDRHFFGLPGRFAGHLLGTGLFIAITVQRLIYLNIEIASRAFASTLNLGLAKGERLAYGLLPTDPLNPWDLTYLRAFPGLIAGAITGFLGLTALSFYHSVQSLGKLSGSILNLSLSNKFFATIGEDTRPLKQKIMGGMGYVLALATAVPVSLVISFFRQVLPLGFSMLVSIAVSPVIALFKGLFLSLSAGRFAKTNDVEMTQKFKNLYSSLDFTGHLPEGEHIADNLSGGKGVQSFIRKSLSLNISTLTEQTLNNIYNAYLNASDKASFLEEGIKEAIKETKEYYTALSCLEYAENKAVREDQIEALSSFVKDYISGKEDRVPELKKLDRNTFSFWFTGKKPALSDAEIEQRLSMS